MYIASFEIHRGNRLKASHMIIGLCSAYDRSLSRWCCDHSL